MTSRPMLLSLLAAFAVATAACTTGGGASPRAGTPTPLASQPAASQPVSSQPATSPGASAPAGGIPEACPDAPPPALPSGQSRVVDIETTLGQIQITVEADLGPNAVGNFVALVECGYYNGVVFHRLVPGFVIQGGDGQYGRAPNVETSRIGSGGPGYGITDDPINIRYERGVVAMARTPQPNSQGSQFFIILDNSAEQALVSAQFPYAILGRVTRGMETVDAIAAMPNASQQAGNAALQPVAMDSVSIERP